MLCMYAGDYGIYREVMGNNKFNGISDDCGQRSTIRVMGILTFKTTYHRRGPPKDRYLCRPMRNSMTRGKT